jgi:choline dehydrogenase-like flavoprotein
MNTDYDVCVVGSGAGGGPIAYELSKAGYSVVVLEKGPWYNEDDFFKDEIVATRRSVFAPNLRDERHVIEDKDNDGDWVGKSTYDTGRDFWNGNVVGGSSNFMSGYFHRLKPVDFRLLSEFGPILGSNIVDWPITYNDLEKYYKKVEHVIGVSGKVIQHPNLEPRSAGEFPFPPLTEHPVTKYIDKACSELNISSLPTPRAILPYSAMGRNGCYYSNYCGSYGCSSGAKGSSRAALLDHAYRTGHCEIKPHSIVYGLSSNSQGKVISANYYDKNGQSQKVTARIFVLACQAIETSRLLLMSPGPKHSNGLANNFGQVGKNLIFSGGGSGSGDLYYENFSANEVEELKIRGLFVNRSIQDWYIIRDKEFGESQKGGTIDFLFRHANAITRANSQKWGEDGLIWGRPLKKKLKSYFTEGRYLRFEVFNDWLPTDNCFVSLDNNIKDKWGNPVARVRVGHHDHDLRIGEYLAEKAVMVFKQMGAENIRSNISGSPPPNLVAGGCRFGNDPKDSVLNSDCRAHDVENLFVSDGSFMPTGGSVPYTWTIYANSFRVADKIIEIL